MAGLLEQMLTFGAAGRVEEAAARYRALHEQVRAGHQALEQRRRVVAAEFERVVRAKTSGLTALGRIRLLSRNLAVRDRQLGESGPDTGLPVVEMAAIDRTLDAGELAVSAVKGSAAGLSSAIGAWALVGAVGTASTGTAISTLSGAALTNATIAWFGGGSLAAGGLGMAGGAAVLGGIVAVPALLVTGYLAHALRAGRPRRSRGSR